MTLNTDSTPSPLGNFSYPPPGSYLHFNYADSLVTSWLTFDPNATNCVLSIWYYQNQQPWMIGYNRTVSANGTKLVPLNLASKDFLGQLNFNYTASDGRPQVFLSPVFAVHDSPQPSPVIWSQGVLAAPTPSPSAVPQTSILKSAAPSSLSVSKSSTTNNSRLGIGAIAGVVIGIVVCVGLAGSLVFYRRRRPNKIQAEVETLSLTDFQSPIPVNIIGGTDATSLHLPELSGDGQLVEMATSYHEDMNVSTGLA